MTSRGSLRVIWGDGTTDLPSDNPGTRKRTLADRLAHGGQPLNTRCARRGLCGGCTVRLVAGHFRQHNGEMITGPAEVKACQGDVLPSSAAMIEVPARAVIAHEPQVVTTFKIGVCSAQQPIVPVVPGVHDHGFAIDVGTTTVVVALVDLVTGRIVAEESAFNRQIELGDDVVTRIQLAASAARREALREAIVAHTLTPLALDTCAAAGISVTRVTAATIAGNTTMLHLLTGTDPTSMGVAPFQPVFTHHRALTAGELQLGLLRADTPVHLLPGFSSYVGADLVAGCLCTGLLSDEGPNLLVDVGTNGEILLRHGDRLLATATAAGPAFEGGRLSRGTRAVPGAIAHIAFPDEKFPPRLEMIPGLASTAGLCGSAYIDFLAAARAIGLLTSHGRLQNEMWRTLPNGFRYYSRCDYGVRLSDHGSEAIITESDVAQLLQAKAAIAAGILTLLRRAGLAPTDVKRLYLAGGFGLHLDVPNAIACGLLPGFVPAQIEVVGNTSLGGAWLALNDYTVLPEMSRVKDSAEIVELNLEPGFEDTFIDQLMLP